MMHISCYNLLALGEGGFGSPLAFYLLGEFVDLGEDVAVAVDEVGYLRGGVHNGRVVASAECFPYFGQ